MNTKLYVQLNSLLLQSGLSKRGFCEKYKIKHSWFIEFINPKAEFRPLQVKTQSLLHNTFNISFEDMNAYNEWVILKRGG